MSGCAKDGFEVVRSYCLELARTKATSIFARSLPMEPKAAQSNLDAGGNCTTKPSEASSRICARGAPVATRSRKSRASSALGSRPPVFGFGSVRLERVHVEHDVKRAENRAERLEWEAGFAIDYAIASIEQANLAVLDAVDGDWRSTHSLAYSRDIESRANVAGSDRCAATGYNPWGLVFVIQGISELGPQPGPPAFIGPSGKGTRIQTLEQHFSA
jgi:hypothetical protein